MINSDWIIFETYAGSILYGTNDENSDIDIRGVCIRPVSEILNPFQNFEQQEFPGEDKVIYDLRKFFQLASDCNPNIVELLFSNYKIKSSKQWELIKENRHLFLSQKVRFTFAGYAHQQLERIKRHRKWIIDPPLKRPERKDFNLPEMPLFGFEKLNSLLASPVEVIIPEQRQYAINEFKYREAKNYWDDYENWMKTRNPKRFELEKKFGYDTKHGLHLYRLYSQAEELLTSGIITLPRPDREFLMEIKRGKLSYEELVETGEKFKERIDAIESDLPKKPDYNSLKELYLDCVIRIF